MVQERDRKRFASPDGVTAREMANEDGLKRPEDGKRKLGEKRRRDEERVAAADRAGSFLLQSDACLEEEIVKR